MKNTKYIIINLLISVILISTSCETDITVDLPTPDEKLVVQGRIENDLPAFVFLSRNLGYFDPVNIPELSDDADIDDFIAAMETSYGLIYDSTLIMTVTDGNIIDTLTPSINFFEFPYFGYKSNMTGEYGKNYRLEIEYKDINYWSETSIPQPADIDSVWFEFLEDNDTSGTLGLFILDEANVRNFYTMETQVPGEQLSYMRPYFGTYAFDDELLDGDTLYYTPLLRGNGGNDFFQDSGSENSTPEEQEAEFIEKAYYDFGETVNIKLCAIDKEAFVFWMSYSKHLSTAGNPFTNPASLQTNINGGNCDGIWAGYASTIRSVVIDENLVRQEEN